MNVEDAMITREGKGKKTYSQYDARLDERRKPTWKNEKRKDRRSRPPVRWTLSFTLLNTLLEQVLMQVRDNPTLKWQDKPKGDPNKRPRNKYWWFHRDHENDTLDYYNLKQQIETLIKQGKLQQFVGWEKVDGNPPKGPEPHGRVEEHLRGIREIVRGTTAAGSSKSSRKTYLYMVQSVQIMGWPPVHSRKGDPPIAFNKEDARWLHYPYDYALVITLSVAYYTTWQVLVDNEGSNNILFYLAFQKMRIGKERLL